MDPTQTYWRSLEDLERSPEFAELLAREFPHEDPSAIPDVSRRRFLQLLGASAALAALTSCRYEEEEILPFGKRPEGTTPGVAKRFATVFEVAGVGQPLLVTSREGRPVKVEGNPDHPASGGASTAFAQGAVLELCDPDRSRSVCRFEGGVARVSDWQQFSREAKKRIATHREAAGKGLRILGRPTSSVTVAQMRERLLEALPEASWHEYEPLHRDAVLDGSDIAFGERLRAHFDLRRVDVLLTVDDDLLATHPDRLRLSRDFASRRDPDTAAMSRVYSAESRLTTVGAMADHRLPIESRRCAWLLDQLSERLEKPSLPAESATERWIAAVAEDLAANRGRSLVTVGDGQPAQAHAIVHRINEQLGNFGATVEFSTEPSEPCVASFRKLVEDMQAGVVDTLVLLDGNPVYDAPADLGFRDALQKVGFTVHASLYRDETSRSCDWHVPLAHALESWGDARAWDGTICIAQPLIAPLYGGKSAAEIVALCLDDDKKGGLDLVRRAVGAELDFATEADWRRGVHAGFFAATVAKRVRPTVRGFDFAIAAPAPDDSIELVLTPDASVWDGRFANSGWLQETPDPITKLTWDNALLVAPSTAQRLGIDNATLVEVEAPSGKLTVPAMITPGVARGSVTLSLGYGRRAAGHVAGNDEVASVGRDAYSLRTADAPSIVERCRVKPTGQKYALATTQDHWAIDTVGMEEREKRAAVLVREADLEYFEAHKDFPKHVTHHPPLESLWKEPSYDGHKWGMSIDLNRCIGCSGCVVACTSENNIPVVGKDEVLRGREMHWMRVDRYFKGEPDAPQVAQQPVTCQHCENAPCEQVCPVAATVHSEEGLNDMAYNRCIGTRYCANNCPYKVRRFNWFDYNAKFEEPENEVAKLAVNPDVTVRMRGVMEKCTYCVQRIQGARIDAKRDGREIGDGDIVTACQQACPTEAIVFGDLADPESRVAKLAARDRSYAMLSEFNIKPRTTYLARVRNPNPKLASWRMEEI